jgi:hypothetical protein
MLKKERTSVVINEPTLEPIQKTVFDERITNNDAREGLTVIYDARFPE